MAGRLAERAQRYTRGRREIVDVLFDAEQPLTVSDLVAAGGRLAQSSTYRNLAVLESAGVVHRVVSSDEFARFELTEELTGHHHHLICTTCGTVADFTVPPKLERTIAAALGSAARRSRFAADGHRLDVVGTCAACA